MNLIVLKSRDRVDSIGRNKFEKMKMKQILQSMTEQELNQCMAAYNGSPLANLMDKKISELVVDNADNFQFAPKVMNDVISSVSLFPKAEKKSKCVTLVKQTLREALINNITLTEVLTGMLMPKVSSELLFKYYISEVNSVSFANSVFRVQVGGRMFGYWFFDNIITTLGLRTGVVLKSNVCASGMLTYKEILGMLSTCATEHKQSCGC